MFPLEILFDISFDGRTFHRVSMNAYRLIGAIAVGRVQHASGRYIGSAFSLKNFVALYILFMRHEQIVLTPLLFTYMNS